MTEEKADTRAADEIARWRGIWERDECFQPARRPGPVGWLTSLGKRLLRPIVKAATADLWERQRQFELLVCERLDAERRLEGAVTVLGEDLNRIQDSILADLRSIRDAIMGYLAAQDERLDHLEGFKTRGIEEMMRHQDALYGLLDAKLESYRRELPALRGQLLALLAAVESGEPAALPRAVEEQTYLELERRHRGTEREIGDRIAPYVPALAGRGEVLDLGCGRGEALELLRDRGIPARGVDSNAQMVARCREKGLDAERGDLFEVLAATPEGTLGGVISFHVIEHLPPPALDRLIRLAWRALSPGGVLVLETPSPLSLVAGARNFWLDPTHLRPVHPDALRLALEMAGFDPVDRVDRQPFAAADRLPSIDLDDLAPGERRLAERVNRLRDALDELLYGHQDYGMIGHKPGR
ncbi:MAG: class I SAM-dependent methyltransferase [Thermoanaerobaculia bacterium]